MKIYYTTDKKDHVFYSEKYGCLGITGGFHNAHMVELELLNGIKHDHDFDFFIFGEMMVEAAQDDYVGGPSVDYEQVVPAIDYSTSDWFGD